MWYIKTIMVPADQSEHSLVQRAQQRDPEALAGLYHRFVGQIYRYCLFRVTNDAAAQDLTGEVFLDMVESLPHYVDRGAPFAAWLYRIARNRVVDYYRRQARRQTDQLTEALQDAAPGPEALAVQQADTQNLRQAMAKLTEDYRLVLQLRFIEGQNLEQTAQQMGKTVGATKVMQHRALRQLARLLGT
jgi:RNA polymerase sigma-70 factor (ECF subfamily)